MFSPVGLKTSITLRVPSRSVSLLSKLHASEGSYKKEKRVGRGPGSGLGKTSGRGQKGQKARSSIPNWFEGGQTPIYKLFPKRGFFRQNKLDLNEVNLARIARFYKEGRLPVKEGEVLTMAHMKKFGLITGPMKDGVSIIRTGRENYTVPLKIEATKASQPAMKAIENAGGEFTAKYYSTSVCFRAHHAPHWFLQKRGYLPLQSRPIARRDILFYGDANRRGYLSKQSDQPSQDTKINRNKRVSQDPLLKQLEESKKTHNRYVEGFAKNKVVSFSEMKN